VTVVFLIFGWGSSVETYAAQLAADHLKCFQFPPDAAAPPDVTLLGKTWQATAGWALKIAASTPTEQLQLLGVRRCGSSRGRVAHVFYKWRGEPLSVYVLNHRFDHAPDAATDHDFNKLGEHAIVWTERERTYAVVASKRLPDLQHERRFDDAGGELQYRATVEFTPRGLYDRFIVRRAIARALRTTIANLDKALVR